MNANMSLRNIQRKKRKTMTGASAENQEVECEEQREYTVGHRKAVGINQRGDAAEAEKQ